MGIPQPLPMRRERLRRITSTMRSGMSRPRMRQIQTRSDIRVNISTQKAGISICAIAIMMHRQDALFPKTQDDTNWYVNAINKTGIVKTMPVLF